MRYSDIGAVFIVCVVCVVVVVGSLILSQKDHELDRLTERAKTALEEQKAENAFVPKSVCLQLVIDERTKKKDDMGLYKSGFRWVAFLNAITALLSILVGARMVRARIRHASE